MIIELILIGITALFLILAILAIAAFGCYADETFPAVCFIFSGFVGFVALICGIICITHNNQAYINSEIYDYQERIKLYRNEKNILESYHLITEGGKTTFTSDITIEKLSTADYYAKVENYNTKIYSFKVNIKTQQYNYHNSWTSWFISPACFSVSDEVLESLTYTIGK